MDETAAKRAVRYLKRGVFPPDAIAQFTAGRNDETRHIADALSQVQQGSSKHCFVEANYGFGKSHMLKIAESLALQRGFAVSWVTINGAEHAFNHPSRYLHSLLENLRVPNCPRRGLVELCGYWLANSERDNLLNWASHAAPSEFTVAIQRMQAAEVDEDASPFDWYASKLEGRDLQQKSGGNYFPDFYRRLGATVSLCRAVGHDGVLFLFDEVECIATQLGNIRSRLLSYQVLNSLVDGRRLPYAMFLFAATEDFGVKIAEDVLYYSEYESTYPEGYRFAKKWHARELNVLPVRNITISDNAQLLRSVRDMHAIAYRWKPAEQMVESFVDDYLEATRKAGSSQREILKWFVEILEIAQQHPNIKPAI
jgi:hypothetical protein